MQFQDEIQAAIQTHAMWKINLLKAIESEHAEIDPDVVRLDDRCAFGKWLYGETIPEKAKAMSEYKSCLELHRQFHELTSDILRMALAGQRKDVFISLSEPGLYYQLSSTLVAHLKLWLALYEKANDGK